MRVIIRNVKLLGGGEIFYLIINKYICLFYFVIYIWYLFIWSLVYLFCGALIDLFVFLFDLLFILVEILTEPHFIGESTRNLQQITKIHFLYLDGIHFLA